MVKKWLGAVVGAALVAPLAVSFFSEQPARADSSQDVSVAIDSKNFPDRNFRKIVEQFDTNGDLVLSQDELSVVKELDVKESQIRDLTGVQYFTELIYLNCDYNELRTLDVSKNINLIELFCGGNALAELDVSENGWLERLWCDENEIESLDLTFNSSLKVLGCGSNRLSKLDLSHNLAITGLSCEKNELTELDLSPTVKMKYLTCKNNKLKSLDVHFLKDLVQLQVEGNQLTELKLGSHPVMDTLETAYNDLTVVDIRQCPTLIDEFTEFGVKSSELFGCFVCEVPLEVENPEEGYEYTATVFTLDYTTNLEGFEIPEMPGYPRKPYDPQDPQDPNEPVVEINAKNFPDKFFRAAVVDLDTNEDLILSKSEIEQVVELNLNGLEISNLTGIEYFTELRILDCCNNKLKTIDVSKNTKLIEFYCMSNELTALDVSALTNLENFWCVSNKLTSIDVSKNTKLRVFFCSENNIKKLDLSHNTEITGFGCDRNQLTELDLSNQKKLMYFTCDDNKLKSLDVSFLKELVQLFGEHNELTEVKLGSHPNLENLVVAYNDITVLDVSQCPALLAEYDEYGIKDDTIGGFFYCGIPEELESAGTGYASDKSGRVIPKTIETKDIEIIEAYIVLSTFDYETNIVGYDVPEAPGHPRKPMPNPNPTPTPTPTPTPPAEDPNFEDFVERLYTVALGRASEPEGKEFWVKQVVEEGKTGADCARFFLLDADEFMKRNLSVEDFVETLYATFFDRESDAAGKKGWIDAISSGAKTRAEVVNDFIESTEWCDVCATYGVKSGAIYHKATKASKNAINFATRLYTCCLKRDAEDGGLKYWSLALTNLEKTGAEAALFFFESDEFIGFKTSDKEYLLRLYTTFMDREPAQSEIDYWLGEIAGGRQTRHSILAFFAQSKEFTEICKTYGIERGQI